MPAEQRRFGGRFYSKEGYTTNKARSMRLAEAYRLTGKMARVYHDPGTTRYYVYVR